MTVERVAIVGSREGADLDAVREFVHALREKYPGSILVSGGASGVDQTAEQEWLSLGGKVESFRPLKRRDSWVIELWELGGDNPRCYVLETEPSWADFKSAATFRDILIVEVADRTVVFVRFGGSRGAGFTAEMSENCYGKPTYRYEARRDEVPAG